MKTRVIAWWSGGITSAVACHWAVTTFKNVIIVWQDTKNEDEDTVRFLRECEKLYCQEIVRLSRFDDKHYGPKNIEEIWYKYETLNNAQGAICSTELKREVREAFQNLSVDFAQVFGFDANEPKRHFNMRKNYPEINVISPLLDMRT